MSTNSETKFEITITLCENVSIFAEVDGERIELCQVTINRIDLTDDVTLADLIAHELMRITRRADVHVVIAEIDRLIDEPSRRGSDPMNLMWECGRREALTTLRQRLLEESQ